MCCVKMGKFSNLKLGKSGYCILHLQTEGANSVIRDDDGGSRYQIKADELLLIPVYVIIIKIIVHP